jgi:hypothetical protein
MSMSMSSASGRSAAMVMTFAPRNRVRVIGATR